MTTSKQVDGEPFVGVLMGGVSNEREVSLETGSAVAAALREKGYTVEEIDVQSRDIPALDRDDIDVFFVALHGAFGEDGQIQEAMEERGVPFTGSGARASRLGMDKISAKKIFREEEIPTPPFHAYLEGDPPAPPPCGLMPGLTDGDGFVVKPRSQGSSIGISIVETRREIGPAVQDAREIESDALVEPRYEGPEVTVGILSGEPLPVIQLEPARDFYDYTAKYEDERTGYILNPDLPDELLEEIQEVSVRGYEALGCEGQARADLILHEDEPYLLEINTIPGMTSHSLLPKAAAEAGMSFADLCERILLSALDEGSKT